MDKGKIVPIGETTPTDRETLWLETASGLEGSIPLVRSQAVAMESPNRSSQRDGFKDFLEPDELRGERHKTPSARTSESTGGVLQVGIQIYRLWFRFLKLALELEELGVVRIITKQGRSFTKDGGGPGSKKYQLRDTIALCIERDKYEGWDLDQVLTNSFDDWWKNHSHLFEGRPIEFCGSNEEPDTGYMHIRIPKTAKLEDVRRFITQNVQPKLEGRPDFVVSGYPRPDVMQNRYNALVLTYKGVSGRDICDGDKIYLRATDRRSRDMREGMEGRLKVAATKSGKILYSSAVSKQRNGGLYHLVEVMQGRFGDVPKEGIKK